MTHVHQGLDPKVATGTPRTRTIGQRAVGFVQVVLWDLRFSGAGPAAGKVTLKETRVCARFLQTSWHNPNVEPTAIWGEKVGRTVEIATLQSIGNIDS